MVFVRNTSRKRRMLVLNQSSVSASSESAAEFPPGQELDDEEISSDAKITSCNAVVDSPTTKPVLHRVVDSDELQLANEMLRADCGSHGLIQLHVTHNPSGKTRRLQYDLPFLLVGHSNECEVRLFDKGVSYRHAYLQMVGGQMYCIDLGSRTGTHWRSGPKTVGKFSPGETITIGPFSIRNESQSEDSQSYPTWDGLIHADPTERAEKGSVYSVEFLNHNLKSEGAGRRVIRRQITLVGRSPRCHIRLDHESVSKVHISLLLTPEGLWAIDLLGRNGVTVNDESVWFSRLRDGDEIQVGKFRLGVRCRLPLDTVEPIETPNRSVEPVIPENWPSPFSGPAAINTSFSESFVLTLVQQFLSMQQQMFSQSQQHNLLLTQMFSSLQQGQQLVLQEEIDRLRKINTEIQLVQTQLLTEQLGLPQAQTPQPVVPEVGDEPSEHGSEELRDESSQAESDVKASAGDIDRDQEVGDEATVDPKQKLTQDLAVKFGLDVSETPPNWADLTAMMTEKPQPDGQHVQQESTDANDADDATGTDFASRQEQTDRVEDDSLPDPERRRPGDVQSHAWLTERINDLERERNSCWRRIMRAISGDR